MPERSADWMRQADRDFLHAEHAMADGDHEWACFAAQQAAEKSVKALFMHLGGEFWGHSLLKMLTDLSGRVTVGADLYRKAAGLDKVYIPTRYPDSFDSGSPMDFFSREDAQNALNDAREIIAYAKRTICEQKRDD